MTNSISQFLNLRKNGFNQYRLIHSKKRIKLIHKNKISIWACMKAQFGCGGASIKKIASFLDKNNHHFSNNMEAHQFNELIVSYNKKRILRWKKAILITENFLKSKSFSLHDTVMLEKAFKGCQKAYLEIKHSPNNFFIKCASLSSLINKIDDHDMSKFKNLLNEILNFKNEVRAACLPRSIKRLKGPCSFSKKKLSSLDQDILRVELKKIRAAVLKKYFKIRLTKNKNELDQLKAKWKLIKSNQSQKAIKCVETQLKVWEKKHMEGKPISLPKWYHCTKTVQIQKLIIESELLFQSKTLPGAFVANYPVTSFGSCGLAFSSYIEKTGTKDPKKGRVFPIQSHLSEEFLIRYADEEQPAGFGHPLLWLGFQRGRDAHFDPTAKKIGIPLYRKHRVQSPQPLEYYKDTSIAFIFNFNYDIKVNENFALANRIKILNKTQVNALRSLVNQTFTLTLPKDWEGKINSFY